VVVSVGDLVGKGPHSIKVISLDAASPYGGEDTVEQTHANAMDCYLYSSKEIRQRPIVKLQVSWWEFLWPSQIVTYDDVPPISF
jgi:hypothetical protein